jgi:hypothetical protein
MRRLVNRSGFILCAAVLLGGASPVVAGQAAGAAAVRSAHTSQDASAARTDPASARAAGTVGELKAVAAVSPANVWAVGCSGSCNGPYSLILHWNGRRWAKVASPDPGRGFDELTGVTAVSARDLWAVGYACTTTPCKAFRTLILHWNGTKWSVAASPDPSTFSDLLYGVTKVSADNVWAAGSYDPDATTPSRTLILRWNGKKWSRVASPSPGTTISVLFGVSAVRADDAWAVGDFNGTGGSINALIEHWNGTKWSQVAAANPGSSFNDFQAVSAASARDIWAVPDQLGASLPYTTLTEHRAGATWSAVASPNKTTSTFGGNVNFLAGVATISRTEVVAVGWVQTFTDPGIAYHVMILTWNGTKWSIA